MKKQMKKKTNHIIYQTCMQCRKSTIPLKNMKERCSVCNKLYLIYGEKIEA